MATNSIAGFKGFVFAGDTGGALQRIAELRNFTLTRSMSEIDVTSRDSSGDREVIGGIRQWSFTAEALYAQDSTGQKFLFNALSNETKQDVEFYPTGTSSGFPIFTGTVFINNWELAGPNDDATALNIEGVGNLVLTAATSS